MANNDKKILVKAGQYNINNVKFSISSDMIFDDVNQMKDILSVYVGGFTDKNNLIEMNESAIASIIGQSDKMSSQKAELDAMLREVKKSVEEANKGKEKNIKTIKDNLKKVDAEVKKPAEIKPVEVSKKPTKEDAVNFLMKMINESENKTTDNIEKATTAISDSKKTDEELEIEKKKLIEQVVDTSTKKSKESKEKKKQIEQAIKNLPKSKKKEIVKSEVQSNVDETKVTKMNELIRDTSRIAKDVNKELDLAINVANSNKDKMRERLKGSKNVTETMTKGISPISGKRENEIMSAINNYEKFKPDTPLRSLRGYSVKELEGSNLDEKTKAFMANSLYSMNAKSYLSGTNKDRIESDRALKGMFTSRGFKDPSAIKEMMSKDRTRLDLEYAPKDIYDSILGDYNKAQIKGTQGNLIDYVYQQRKSNPELDTNLLNIRNTIQSKSSERYNEAVEQRLNQYGNVKYGIHAGETITPGRGGKGGSKSKSPILFSSEEEVEKFINEKFNKSGNVSADKLASIKKSIVKNYDDDFKSIYGDKATSENMSKYVYGVPKVFGGKNPNANSVGMYKSTDHVTQLEALNQFLGNSVDKIKINTMETAQNLLEASKLSNEGSKNKLGAEKIVGGQQNAVIANNQNVSDTRHSIADLGNINPIRSDRNIYQDQLHSLQTIVGLEQLRVKSSSDNIDLDQLTSENLKYQKKLLGEISTIENRINAVKERGLRLKEPYNAILIDKNTTEQQKLDAQMQIDRINQSVAKKIGRLSNVAGNKKEVLGMSKKIMEDTINNYLKQQGIDPKIIKEVMQYIKNPSKIKELSHRGGTGGNIGGSGGMFPIISPEGSMSFGFGSGGSGGKPGKFSTELAAMNSMYSDTLRTIGKFRTGMSQIRMFMGVAEDLAKIEEAVFDLGVVGQQSIVQIRKLRGEFLMMASDSRYSAVELATAAADVVRVGYNFKDSMIILKSGETLATASFDNIKDATNTLIKAMTAFGLNATSAAHAANSFHNIVNATPLDLKTFDDSLRQTAAAFGSIVYFSSRSGEELEEYKKSVLDTTAVLTGLQSVLGRTGSQAKIVLV